LSYRKFPVSLTGFGFAVQSKGKLSEIKLHLVEYLLIRMDFE
jgi:hypothetical protein